MDKWPGPIEVAADSVRTDVSCGLCSDGLSEYQDERLHQHNFGNWRFPPALEEHVDALQAHPLRRRTFAQVAFLGALFFFFWGGGGYFRQPPQLETKPTCGCR